MQNSSLYIHESKILNPGTWIQSVYPEPRFLELGAEIFRTIWIITEYSVGCLRQIRAAQLVKTAIRGIEPVLPPFRRTVQN